MNPEDEARLRAIRKRREEAKAKQRAPYDRAIEWMGWADTPALRSKYLEDAPFHHLMDALSMQLRALDDPPHVRGDVPRAVSEIPEPDRGDSE